MKNNSEKSDLRIAVAQFEHRNADKVYNLAVMDRLAGKAAAEGARAVSFHELSVTGYAFLRRLTRDELFDLAEPVPEGPSTAALIAMARRHGLVVLGGILERREDRVYNTYVAVDGEGLIARFSKLHPFIHESLSPGDGYTTFELDGWTCGILICYDNNVIENVRATTFLGAELLFAPHVTGCTPSPMPGRGYVDPILWEERERDPAALRLEFDGPKGRRWLHRWLPARAYDNGIYLAYSNPIGMDDDQLKPGGSLILDPFGEILTEVRSFEDTIAVATLIPEKLTQAGGYRYRNARRPELYGEILGRHHRAVTKPVWLKKEKK